MSTKGNKKKKKKQKSKPQNNLVKYDCYIEEYVTIGGLCARLRDKVTNKQVILIGRSIDKFHFLTFLSQAKKCIEVMPTIYDRTGDDIVAVRGFKVCEDEGSITINTDIEKGGYLFE